MIEQIEAELREARLARESEKVGALTMLLAALKDAEKANGGTLDDAGANAVCSARDDNAVWLFLIVIAH